jgi:HEPN domain-containing protein
MNRWHDWYEQGKRDYTRALWACFTLQQASEKVVKALGLARDVTLLGHSLTDMLRRLNQELVVPEEVLDSARLLDLYYIPPCYPNGFASGKPADYVTETQAQEGLHAADRVIRFCESHLPGSR